VARHQRDSAFERGRAITKGIAFGAVAAVAAAGVYLSQALPGHAASTGTSNSGAASTGTSGPAASGTSTGSAGSSQGSVSSPAPAPAPAPAPTYRQPRVVSGSS
jgi:hypothetical protein